MDNYNELSGSLEFIVIVLRFVLLETIHVKFTNLSLLIALVDEQADAGKHDAHNHEEDGPVTSTGTFNSLPNSTSSLLVNAAITLLVTNAKEAGARSIVLRVGLWPAVISLADNGYRMRRHQEAYK